MIKKLKACPFCGGAAIFLYSWKTNTTAGCPWVAVGCASDKDCPAKNWEQDEQGGFACEFLSEEDAIKNWNYRPAEDELRKRITELEELLVYGWRGDCGHCKYIDVPHDQQPCKNCMYNRHYHNTIDNWQPGEEIEE